jgi:hypothetical protein
MFNAILIQSARLRCCRYLLEVILRYTSKPERQKRTVDRKRFLSSRREKKGYFLLKLSVTAFKGAVCSKIVTIFYKIWILAYIPYFVRKHCGRPVIISLYLSVVVSLICDKSLTFSHELLKKVGVWI